MFFMLRPVPLPVLELQLFQRFQARLFSGQCFLYKVQFLHPVFTLAKMII
jgi:hypothetical protein